MVYIKTCVFAVKLIVGYSSRNQQAAISFFLLHSAVKQYCTFIN
jgi:hypothetical protein